MRDRAVIARAAEIIEREASALAWVNNPIYAGTATEYLRAEHADMLATAKALRAMIEEDDSVPL